MSEAKVIEEIFNINENQRIHITNQSADFIVFTLQDKEGNQIVSDKYVTQYAVPFAIIEEVHALISTFTSKRNICDLFVFLPLQKRFVISSEQDKAVVFTYVSDGAGLFYTEKRISGNRWERSSSNAFKLPTIAIIIAHSMVDEIGGFNDYVLKRIEDEVRCKNCVVVEKEGAEDLTLKERIKNYRQCRECLFLLKMCMREDFKKGDIQNG